MFSLHKPNQAELQYLLHRASDANLSYNPKEINTRKDSPTPQSFSLDHTRSKIGHGQQTFAAARAAMHQWRHFDLGWVQIANPEATIVPGQIVAVEAHTLGLWSINCNRILYVIDEERRFGYAYGTTRLHVESGEERFLIEQDSAGDLWYDLLAISRPRHWLARLGYPYTRSQQRRFARDSHARLANLS